MIGPGAVALLPPPPSNPHVEFRFLGGDDRISTVAGSSQRYRADTVESAGTAGQSGDAEMLCVCAG